MSKKAQTGTSRTGSAVSASGVTKLFVQWQRDNTGKGMIRNLVKPEKRDIRALDDVSFEIMEGEFVAYAGPNGAGKSTTMKLLAGMLVPTSGAISVLSMSPQKQRRALMRRVGVLFGNRTELWWDHPVIQSFEWKKVVWGIPDGLYRKNLGMVAELLGLGGLLKTFARELSLGQRMRADLAMLLLHSPSLILLDEPTLGLDVVAKRQMIDFLKTINREDGVTIVVTSHDMDDLEEMAKRILMVSDGKIAYDGSFDGLRGITGNLTRVRIAMDAGAAAAVGGAAVAAGGAARATGRTSVAPGGAAMAPAELAGATLVKADDGIYEYDVDAAKTPIRQLLRRLSETDGVKDVEIGKAPIEQVIASLYAAWKRTDGAEP